MWLSTQLKDKNADPSNDLLRIQKASTRRNVAPYSEPSPSTRIFQRFPTTMRSTLEITPKERFWVDNYHTLLAAGYQLRPRFHPEWKPSPIKYDYEIVPEDHVALRFRVSAGLYIFRFLLTSPQHEHINDAI